MKILSLIFFAVLLWGCSSRKMRTGASQIEKDSLTTTNSEIYQKAHELLNAGDSVRYETFSAKVKINYEDTYGSQPEVNAYVRIKKDEFIWISLTATFLNIEGARVMIYPDSVVVINKLEKTIETHPLTFLQELVALPLTFDDAQKLILGETVLAGDSVTETFASDKFLRLNTINDRVENDMYFTIPDYFLARQVLTNMRSLQNYTADIMYEDYEKTGESYFATLRNILIPAYEQKIKLTFKEYEFNKELSVPFTRPNSYTVK